MEKSQPNQAQKERQLAQKFLSDAKNAKKKKRRCMYPNCLEYSINSHLLQKRGVLSEIANEGKFVEYDNSTPYQPEKFALTGINETDMFTFRGFCNFHDTETFRDIENGLSNFSEYRHQLLFYYRAVSNQLFDSEYTHEYLERVIEDARFTKERKSFYLEDRTHNMISLKDLQYFKHRIEDELFNVSPDPLFVFHQFQLHRIDVVASVVIGGSWNPDLNYDRIANLDPFHKNYNPASIPVFFNLIPHKNSTVMLLGHLANANLVELVPLENIPKLNQTNLLRWVSRILTKTNIWGMSIHFYKKLEEEGKISQYHTIRNNWRANSRRISRHHKPSRYQAPPDFNLFSIDGTDILGRRLL